jgi:hypothetical protein
MAKKYYSIYRLSVSGPDLLTDINVLESVAQCLVRNLPTEYRIEVQAGWIN